MESYAVEKVIADLTNRIANAKRMGMKRILLNVRETENVILLLCSRVENNREPVIPVPDEILNKLGWHDMQDCGVCGNQLRSMANFCDVCGTPVKKVDGDGIRQS